ncbi:Small-conductance mechanosensitive channel MscK (MscK) [Commensalibacter communis]|uniref:Small-conductance mechanosensitive channel MscK (MscK) n=1 Tax=Commensalibacter communis TaxID=2972786 RepID=A0A9W4X6D8_9PROT|nr:mechanosensitive ion channel domain-containing protein [Commensalibacter communis]CAI3935156.1 Small-conductance mechanosensitive channel MscK (MscK) [Commensalibacter communis]CAI3937133.1 Small-conductance mechanosensitive channel MscK (MscK) [Commensalibacter communis]CAI3943053.1 Small-conductance mechanosensitive channel MscK (MscK) [Commensalibacter communis]CAI3943190.1 Small-conductance mechanosensitive channel MscK (MscK) [Commensalibacter communis]CAI3943470.1 Small-conductance me
MRLIIRSFFILLLMLGVCITSTNFAFAQQNTTNTATNNSSAPSVFVNLPDTTTQPQLDSMTKQLKSISKSLQSMGKSEDRNAFKNLLGQVQDISITATDLIKVLQPRLAGYTNALKILESTKDTTTAKSDDNKTTADSSNATVDDYQQSLSKNRRDLQLKIQQATIIQLEANSQIAQIQQILDNIQQVQMFTHLPSPLSGDFWAQISLYHKTDQARLTKIYTDFSSLFSQTWNDGLSSRAQMLGGILVALLIIFFARPFIEKIITKIVERTVPPTRLRRSLMTLCAAILSSITAGVSATVIFASLGYQDNINHSAFEFSQHIIHQLYFCGFILGLYRGFLAVKSPQWRLLPIGDKTAQAVNILPIIYALMVFLLGVVKYINSTSGVSIFAQQLCNGFFTILAAFLFLSIPIKLRQIGTERLSSGTNNAPGLGFFFIAIGLPIFCIVSIITVLAGYIHLGYSMSVWLNWVILVFSTLNLLKILLIDITNLFFDPDRWVGQKIRLLGIKPQSMEQLATVITGAITVLTVLLIIASFLSPGNFDLVIFAQHLSLILQTQKIGNISISFASIAQAFVIFIIGIYVIRIIRNWLNEKLFPKTTLDHATRNSIDTIFNYCCWIIVAVIILSTLGVTAQNITWIVSALSVGIGFGLQAIVQNFVSGLILLAERPVRLGDSVTVGGVKGTVKSIKVRATEIQLSDFSTLIVPNSQLITSSVQNSTRSRHMGLISIKLPVIAPRQLERAKTLILDIMNNHPEVVETPKPSVLVDSVTEIALVMSITCYVNPTSSTDGVKSDILTQYLNEISKIATTIPMEKSEPEESLASGQE